MKMHAYAMGFWDHPEYKLEIQRALHKDRRSNVIQLGSSEKQNAIRTPRMGKSISPSLDKFYDTYFGPASVSSMWTERGISKLQYHVGGLSCIKTDRVNLRMYKYNKGLLGELHMDIAEWKKSLKDMRKENYTARQLRNSGETPNPRGSIALFKRHEHDVSCAIASYLYSCLTSCQ